MPGSGGPQGGSRDAFGAELRRELLRVARSALGLFLERGQPGPDEASSPEAPGPPHSGVFVSLACRGELRGCIGTLDPRVPLREAVRSCAVSAARDPRFAPLTRDELDETLIEISVLGPFRPVSGPGDVRVGIDGLVISLGVRRGLLLPKVAGDRRWDPERFLDETCRKAGLPPGAWSSGGAAVEAFEAEVFGDPEGAT